MFPNEALSVSLFESPFLIQTHPLLQWVSRARRAWGENGDGGIPAMPCMRCGRIPRKTELHGDALHFLPGTDAFRLHQCHPLTRVTNSRRWGPTGLLRVFCCACGPVTAAMCVERRVEMIALAVHASVSYNAIRTLSQRWNPLIGAVAGRFI